MYRGGDKDADSDTLMLVRYVSHLSISNFRCFEDAKIDLQDVTILFGPNNSGKSAFLNVIRRFASANLQRHPIIGSPGGLSGLGNIHNLKFEQNDSRLESREIAFSIEIEKAALDRIRTMPHSAYGQTMIEHFTMTCEALFWPLRLSGK